MRVLSPLALRSCGGSHMLCLCAAQLKSWSQTYLGRETLASYYRQGRQLLLTFLTLVTRWSRPTSNFYALIGQNLTGVHAGNLCNILKLVLLWQLKLVDFFVNRCTRNEIQLLSRVFCYSWLVCLLGFWLRNKLIFTVKWMTHLSLSPDRAYETITEATMYST